ncbi:NADPH-dependent FMN reductase [Pedobacter caeni]|uniref:Arsenical resistance protein ArsH n=1 Tax=Pedobacter caeni TaxID=288992 RepID=A0A1M4W5Z2_9SPHI|nr:NADPH-dependent FMN reductase [Pedobacter caeni]SHE76555.1 arsenical resistance protein ArsH [Pedobacter caeni]
MSILIFNGSLDRRSQSTANSISTYLKQHLEEKGITATVFNLADAHVPFFDATLPETPKSVELMVHEFRKSDLHIWLSPLYHGGMTGAMKNSLDWLEISRESWGPYLTGKVVGLVCWADGGYAIQGINAMDAVARSLRAWTLPFFVPAVRNEIYDEEGRISPNYQKKFELLVQLLTDSKKTGIENKVSC